jgi:predicted transcriptional regulator
MIDGFMENVEIREKETDTGEFEEPNLVSMKEYSQLWKNILQTMEGDKKSIPQIAEELAVDKEVITYNVMTMNKYNVVMASGMDDNEQYYYYRIKNQ